MKRVLVAVPDLLFGVPVAKAVQAAGADALTVRNGAQALGWLDADRQGLPDAVVVDLSAGIDPNGLIAAACKQGIPVFAFGSHINAAAIRDARAAGADKVVANSALASALPAWLAHCLRD